MVSVGVPVTVPSGVNWTVQVSPGGHWNQSYSVRNPLRLDWLLSSTVP